MHKLKEGYIKFTSLVNYINGRESWQIGRACFSELYGVSGTCGGVFTAIWYFNKNKKIRKLQRHFLKSMYRLTKDQHHIVLLPSRANYALTMIDFDATDKPANFSIAWISIMRLAFEGAYELVRVYPKLKGLRPLQRAWRCSVSMQFNDNHRLWHEYHNKKYSHKNKRYLEDLMTTEGRVRKPQRERGYESPIIEVFGMKNKYLW